MGTCRPGSEEIRRNLAVVDAGARRLSELSRRHWRGDDGDRTAFVFTSDHGMTDWGSHGTGMAHETEVPFLAWGAGVRRPDGKEEEEKAKAKAKAKGDLLDERWRSDLDQADVTPFMAALLGENRATLKLQEQ